MNHRILQIIILSPLFFFMACSGEKGSEGDKPGKDVLKARIDSLETAVDEKSSEGDFSEKRMRKLMGAYKSYVEHYPDDSLAPEKLFRAGSVARSLNEPQRAINIYRRILNEYPDTDREPTIRFLLAFTYDQDLEKKDKAKELYRAVIDSFPDHKLAKDAEQYLKIIDLSDEELIERFEKQQKDSAKVEEIEKKTS